MGDNVYQVRYLEHQARKRASLLGAGTTAPAHPHEVHDFLDLVKARRSVRRFQRLPGAVPWRTILGAALTEAPSSCNRQAVYAIAVTTPEKIAELERFLVGGAGWLHTAECVLLFFFDPVAYKSPAEKAFMPWLDVGAAVMTAAYMATRLGVASCWVNPHARPELEAWFGPMSMSGLVLGSALALGAAAEAPPRPPRRDLEEALLGVL